MYDAAEIPGRLDEIAAGEASALRTMDADRRYHAFQRLLVKVMILEELYLLDVKQQNRLRVLQEWYRKELDAADDIIQDRTKKRDGPFVVVRHDRIAPIVDDSLAVKANAKRVQRTILGLEKRDTQDISQKVA